MSTKLAHRREIQGLRALAVLSVITNHLFPAALPGGFIGVDVFFLLSGFLITQQLLELSQSLSRRDALIQFYARRIKRILPSALLVIWVTIWLSFKYLGPVIGNENLRDGGFATLFFANSHFNQLKVNYFGEGGTAPLLQHYWSLAVEEQFYILWPLVLLLIATLSKRHSRKVLISSLSLIIITSFAGSYLIEGTQIYFSTQARVWELGAGALLAICHLPKLNQSIASLALAILIVSFFLIDQLARVPGPILMPPLIGTTILLQSSNKATRAILGHRVLSYLGDISFVLYLWHWPIIELHRQLSGQPLSIESSLVLLLLILLCAVVTHHLFENPLRFNKFLSNHPKTTIWLGATAISASVFATHLLMKG